MIKKRWVNKARSPQEAVAFDLRYYLAMTPGERLAVIQYLRELGRKFPRNIRHGSSRKGLRRVVTVVQ